MKMRLLCFGLLFLLWGFVKAQPIYTSLNVSTGTDGAGNAIAVGNPDPLWYFTTNPTFPNTTARVCTYFAGYWQTTPVGGTNAGWINYSATPYGGNPAGYYTYERQFYVAGNVTSFQCNFGIAYDDVLISLELVRPDGSTIPLTVVPTSAYQLSQPITDVVNSPMVGNWTIRAVVHYIDAAAAMLLSGEVILTTSSGPCANNFLLNSDFSQGQFVSSDGGSFYGCANPPTQSYAVNWCGIGSPQYANLGAPFGFGIAMWGIGNNFASGEGIAQAVNLTAGTTYTFGFSGLFRDVVPTSPNDVMIRFTAYNTLPTSVNQTGGTVIGQVTLTNTNWANYSLTPWVAPANFSYIAITAHNSSTINSGQYASWAWIDNVCAVARRRFGPPDGKMADQSNTIDFAAYPNPFQTQMNLEVRLPEEQTMTLQIFSMDGKLVSTLHDGQAEAGKPYNYTLQAGDMLPGIYFARLTLGSGEVKHYKLMLQH